MVFLSNMCVIYLYTQTHRYYGFFSKLNDTVSLQWYTDLVNGRNSVALIAINRFQPTVFASIFLLEFITFLRVKKKSQLAKS